MAPEHICGQNIFAGKTAKKSNTKTEVQATFLVEHTFQNKNESATIAGG